MAPERTRRFAPIALLLLAALLLGVALWGARWLTADRHATGDAFCRNTPWSVVVYLLRGGETRGMTQCLNAMELELVALP